MSLIWKYIKWTNVIETRCYLKGAAAPSAAGPFNSTLHTGDPILGLNVALLYFITYALHWWHVVSSCVVVNLFLALRALCLAC